MSKEFRTEEQKNKDLMQALIESRRFQARAEEYIAAFDAYMQLEKKYPDAVLDWRHPSHGDYAKELHKLPSLPPLSAATKRASMDLTKALSKYRNG